MRTYRNGQMSVYPIAGSRRRAVVCALCLSLCSLGAAGAWADEQPPAGAGAPGEAVWKSIRPVDGVALESRPAASGFDEVRGRVTVCTSVPVLDDFVGDPERFTEWIPFTEAAHEVAGDGDCGPAPCAEASYYLRTSTPWPLRSRDLIYHVMRRPADGDGTLRIDLRGDPDALPPRDDAVRMAGASGAWILKPGTGDIDVMLQMTVDPGGVPALFANRRLAASVGQMLANLRDRFACR